MEGLGIRWESGTPDGILLLAGLLPYPRRDSLIGRALPAQDPEAQQRTGLCSLLQLARVVIMGGDHELPPLPLSASAAERAAQYEQLAARLELLLQGAPAGEAARACSGGRAGALAGRTPASASGRSTFC